MVDAAKLKDLLARIEAATEGDEDLDRDIAIALGWTPPAMGLPHWHDDEGNHWSALPDWSTSIDDALALVERVKPGVWWHIAKGRLTASEPLFGAELLFDDMESLGHGEAATAPLAILAALLRSIEGGERG